MMPDADMMPPDMLLELQQFDQAADQLIASFLKTIEAPLPPIIYHYTAYSKLKHALGVRCGQSKIILASFLASFTKSMK